jgi:hypothetical protein
VTPSGGFPDHGGKGLKEAELATPLNHRAASDHGGKGLKEAELATPLNHRAASRIREGVSDLAEAGWGVRFALI